jgi:hypothetical protein
MKKLFFVMLGLAISAAVVAQTSQTKKDDPKTKKEVKKTEMKDLRSDVRDRQAATHQVNKDLSHVRIGKAIKDHKTVHRIKKDEKSDARRLKQQGVDHAVAKAERQVKVQDDNRKDHMNE